MSLATAKITHFYTKVAGVIYPNRDGSSRQEIISRCQQCEQVDLIPEPDNPVDSNAIAVIRENGEQIGYLPRDLAKDVGHWLAQGYQYVAFVVGIIGPDQMCRTRGVDLKIVKASPGATHEEIQAYIDQM